MGRDPAAEGLARLQRLRSRLPAETQRAIEAANSDRNALAHCDTYFAPDDLGFAIVEGTKEVRDREDGVSLMAAVVDGAARSAAIEARVSRAVAQTDGHADPEALVIQRLRSRAESISDSEDRFAALLGLHPLDV